MRKVIVSEFLTLDGVMQAPGGADEDRGGGLEHGDWQGPYFDDAAGSENSEIMAATGGFLLGRVTYEIFAGFWPSAPADNPLADTNQQPPQVRRIDNPEGAPRVEQLASDQGRCGPRRSPS